ncbi:hypothetical protein IPH92_00385 [Candidatus Kaiserbacteria bacterium]|nr:MAG: hypothetical protein IPH92_00385 [Candidatus Kaiserbacteria bacterium]
MARKKRNCDHVRSIKRAVANWLKHAQELDYQFRQEGEHFKLAIGIAKPNSRTPMLNSVHLDEIQNFFDTLLKKFNLVVKEIERAAQRLVLYFQLPVYTT